MSAIVFLLIALVISIIGSLAVLFRHRGTGSIESGIHDFRREMQALAPRPDDDARHPGDARDPRSPTSDTAGGVGAGVVGPPGRPGTGGIGGSPRDARARRGTVLSGKF